MKGCMQAVSKTAGWGWTFGGVTTLIWTSRSSLATMGWKQRGQGDALRRLSPPWLMRWAMIEGKAKTWPQGVICGQTGASSEMGQLISWAVSISTCRRKAEGGPCWRDRQDHGWRS